MKAKFINPYTDFGFKKLFGEEANKDLLIDFLNEVIAPEHKIVDLTFNPTEKLGAVNDDRKAIFDIYCTGTNQEKFIIEMQKAKIKFFKDRAIFYSTFPIKEQAEKGDWDYQLSPVYCVAILDFEFDRKTSNNDFLSNVKLKDQYCEVFYEKLTYVFIEMPRFNKKEDELKTHFDKWLYFLKNLENFNEIPNILKEPIFMKGFEISEIANYNEKQLSEYENSLKTYRDLKGAIDTSFEEGEKIGIEKGEKIGIEKGEKIGIEKGEKIGIEKGEKLGIEKGEKLGIEKGEKLGIEKEKTEIAKTMKKKGIDFDLIVEVTGLSKDKIENL